MTLLPEIRAKLVYDALGDRRAYLARFIDDPGGQAFRITGLQPKRLSEEVGVGLGVALAPGLMGRLFYDAEIRRSNVTSIGVFEINAEW